jgi:hypothetical protein
MIKWRKNLAAIILGLSGCVSQPVCPSNLEKTKAGYYFITAARMAESNKEEELETAKRIYDLGFSLYFSGCKSEACHSEKHYCESLESAFADLHFSSSEKEKTMANLEKIREDKSQLKISKLH